MSSMQSRVHRHVERFRAAHEARKQGRYGWLVAPATHIGGWLVLIAGLIMIPLPGQGWLVTFLGIGILSLEQRWARVILDRLLNFYDRTVDWYHRQPKATRIAVWVISLIVIWAVFALVTYVTWRSGWASFLDPWFARLGLTRS